MPNYIRLLLLSIALMPVLACGLDAAPIKNLWPLTETTPEPTLTPVQYLIGPYSASDGLGELTSYRANLILEFEGVRNREPAAGRIESLTEVTRQPPARHRYLKTELITPTTEPASGVAELYETEDRLVAKKPGEDTWLALNPATGQERWPSPPELGLLELDQLIVLPLTVSTPPQVETMNGLSAQHYTFSENDLPDSNIVVERAEGELWVATPGDFLLQYVISASLKLQTPLPDAHLFDQGQLTLRYALTDINTVPAITPPDIDAILARNHLDQLPRLPDAQIAAVFPTLLEYTSVISPISATLFYRDQLTALEWTENSADIFNEKSRLSYAKEGQAVTILITPGDKLDQVKVVLEVKD